MGECDRILGTARQLVSVAQPVCIYVCVWVHSLRVSTVMISSLHRRWQVWLSVSCPELKRRHSIHSLKHSSATSTPEIYLLKWESAPTFIFESKHLRLYNLFDLFKLLSVSNILTVFHILFSS